MQDKPVHKYGLAVALLQRRLSRLVERPQHKNADKEKRRREKMASYQAALDILTAAALREIADKQPETGTGGRS